NHATVIKLRAERRMAEVVDEGQAKGEIAKQGKPKPPDSGGLKPTLDELGVSQQRLSEARKIAKNYTDEDIQELAAQANPNNNPLSREKGLSAQTPKPAPKPEPASPPTLACQPLADLRSGDYRRVLNEVRADLIFTSPPYNIGSKQPRADGIRKFGMYDGKSF